MQPTSRTALTYTMPILAMFLTVHFISACGGTDDSTSLDNQQARPTEENAQAMTKLGGTAAVSPEALFDFLYVATLFGFWNCESSGDTKDTYIVLDSKDDETDEGFNPLLLLGHSREPQLAGDPRARNNDDVELQVISVSYEVTGKDSISVTTHADDVFSPSVEDNVRHLTTVRTGPGRMFTAEDQLNNVHVICTANNVGANIML